MAPTSEGRPGLPALATPQALFNDALYFMELGQALPRGRGVDHERWRYFRTAILAVLAALEHQLRTFQEQDLQSQATEDLWRQLESGGDSTYGRTFRGGGRPPLQRLLALRHHLVGTPAPAGDWQPQGLEPEERARQAISDTRRLLRRLHTTAGTAAPPWLEADTAGPPS